MKKTFVTLAFAAASALPSVSWAIGAQEAVNVMARNHFVAPDDLQKQYGYWTAEAVSNDGVRATVLVNDATGSFTAVRKANIGGTLPSVERVAQQVRANGYNFVYDIELDDGFWKVKARQSISSREKVELVLHPVTLELLSQVGLNGGTVNGQLVLSAEQIMAALLHAGYTRVRSVEYEDGYWEAEATNTANLAVELRLDPFTGSVLSERLDD